MRCGSHGLRLRRTLNFLWLRLSCFALHTGTPQLLIINRLLASSCALCLLLLAQHLALVLSCRRRLPDLLSLRLLVCLPFDSSLL